MYFIILIYFIKSVILFDLFDILIYDTNYYSNYLWIILLLYFCEQIFTALIQAAAFSEEVGPLAEEGDDRTSEVTCPEGSGSLLACMCESDTNAMPCDGTKIIVRKGKPTCVAFNSAKSGRVKVSWFIFSFYHYWNCFIRWTSFRRYRLYGCWYILQK